MSAALCLAGLCRYEPDVVICFPEVRTRQKILHRETPRILRKQRKRVLANTDHNASACGGPIHTHAHTVQQKLPFADPPSMSGQFLKASERQDKVVQKLLSSLDCQGLNPTMSKLSIQPSNHLHRPFRNELQRQSPKPLLSSIS